MDVAEFRLGAAMTHPAMTMVAMIGTETTAQRSVSDMPAASLAGNVSPSP